MIATVLMLKKIISEQKGFRDRYLLIWETDKNSFSQNLLRHFKQHIDFFKEPKIVYCMDSMVPAYDGLYLTRSLKGVEFYSLFLSLLE